MDQPSRPSLKRGDRIQTTEYPSDYPLLIVVIAGGKIGVGSPRWPRGATWPIELHQVTMVNDRAVKFPPPTKQGQRYG